MAAERPYLLAPVQGLLVQRSGILWQMYGQAVGPLLRQRPFGRLGASNEQSSWAGMRGQQMP